MNDDRLFDALDFAVRAHRGQFRKATRVPYITHPLRVAEILIRLDCPQPLVIAALLHDTVEDTPVTLDEVRRAFGTEVAALVNALSEPEHDTAPWEQRKQHTIAFLRTAPEEVLLVACADKLDNLRSIQDDLLTLGERVWERFNAPREAQAWYYRRLAAVFTERLTTPPGLHLARVLQRAVQEVFPEE